MNVINPPIAATCHTGENSSATSGKPNTATRAPQAKLPATETTTQTPRQISAAYGDSTNAPPTKHITAFPPRNPAKTGNACPAIAPATPAQAPHQPASAHPASPATHAFSASPDERRPRPPRAELLERVPRPRVAVARPPQVDAVPPRDQQRDRDRTEQVAQQG